jgi:hypothetical protein
MASPLEFTNVAEWKADIERTMHRLVNDAQSSFEQLVEKTTADLASTGPTHYSATISSHMVKGARRWVADIGPPVASFPLVFYEFGAVHTPAQPWLRSGFDGAWAGWSPWR